MFIAEIECNFEFYFENPTSITSRMPWRLSWGWWESKKNYLKL